MTTIKTWQERAGKPPECNPKPYAYGWYWEHALEEISELRAALQAQQSDALDAARYRWLRDSPDSGSCIRAMYEDGLSHPKDFDALVDAAMADSKAYAAAPVAALTPLTRCAAGRDGECAHADCPQLRDGEPLKSGRHCPLDTAADEP